MKKIRLSKEFKFEMAHALYGYDGLCANIHGHSYRLWVTIRGDLVNQENNAKNGMLLDFGAIKEIVKPLIIDKYDHSLVLNKNSPHKSLNLSLFDRVIFLPYQPTSENLVLDFVSILQKNLPKNIELLKVILSETATSYAEWNADDNL